MTKLIEVFIMIRFYEPFITALERKDAATFAELNQIKAKIHPNVFKSMFEDVFQGITRDNFVKRYNRYKNCPVRTLKRLMQIFPTRVEYILHYFFPENGTQSIYELAIKTRDCLGKYIQYGMWHTTGDGSEEAWLKVSTYERRKLYKSIYRAGDYKAKKEGYTFFLVPEAMKGRKSGMAVYQAIYSKKSEDTLDIIDRAALVKFGDTLSDDERGYTDEDKERMHPETIALLVEPIAEKMRANRRLRKAGKDKQYYAGKSNFYEAAIEYDRRKPTIADLLAA